MPFGEHPSDDHRAVSLIETNPSLDQKNEQELLQLFESRLSELRAALDREAMLDTDSERAKRLRSDQELLLQRLEASLDPDEFNVPVYTDENGQPSFLKDYFGNHLDYIDDLQDILTQRVEKIYAPPTEPASANADLFPDGRVPMPGEAEYTPVANEFVRRLEASANNAPPEMVQMLNRLDEERRREREQIERLEAFFSLPAPEPGIRGIYDLPSLPTAQTRDVQASTVAEVATPRRGDEFAGFNDETVVMPIVQPQAQKKPSLFSKVKSFFGLG